MVFTLSEIADALDARLEGAGELRIVGASEPATASADQLALASDPKYAEGLAQGSAKAALLWEGADWQSLGLQGAIFARRPRYAMASLTRTLDPGPAIARGIHPTAVIDPTARLGERAAIGPNVVIGADAVIGDDARIGPLVTIGEGARIGAAALIQAGARIAARVTIGDRVVMNPGCVIGGDGFSFVTPDKSAVEQVRGTLGEDSAAEAQSWTRIHSLGGVEVGDDVEIGSNSTIDRGTIRATRIGRGTKIDNLVMIGHNVTIGEDCLLCGQVGVSGSAAIGNRVVLAGQTGVNDNIFIGDDVVAGGASKIFTNVPKGRVLLGYPAVKMTQHIEMYKALRRLPRLVAQVAELQKAVSKDGGSD